MISNMQRQKQEQQSMKRLIKTVSNLQFSSQYSDNIQDIQIIQVNYFLPQEISILRHNCANIKKLRVEMDLNYEMIDQICKMNLLQQLSIGIDYNIDKFINKISKINNLKCLCLGKITINLDNCHNLKSYHLLNLVNAHSSLQKLSLKKLSKLNPEYIQCLLKINNLISLSFIKIDKPIQSKALKAIFKLINIKQLFLIKCKFKNSSDLLLIKDLSSLQCFYLENTQIKSEIFQPLIKALPSTLQKFSFNGVNKMNGSNFEISPNIMSLIFNKCTKLTQINFGYLSSTQMLQMCRLKDNFKQIKINNMYSCSLQNSTLISIIHTQPSLITLNLNEYLSLEKISLKQLSSCLKLLQNLTIQNNQFDIREMIYLKQMKNIKSLNITSNQSSLYIIRQTLTNLKKLKRCKLYEIVSNKTFKEQIKQVSKSWILMHDYQ